LRVHLSYSLKTRATKTFYPDKSERQIYPDKNVGDSCRNLTNARMISMLTCNGPFAAQNPRSGVAVRAPRSARGLLTSPDPVRYSDRRSPFLPAMGDLSVKLFGGVGDPRQARIGACSLVVAGDFGRTPRIFLGEKR